MTELHFINHSSILISKNNINFAMDPWISGLVFNNSWKLLVNTPKNSEELLKKSNYVWFSHEHPDHFNPPNLKIFNKNTNFIFQKTKDQRVVNYIKKKISNKVHELAINNELKITDDFIIKIIPFKYLDSMCLIKIDGLKILNLNDCDIKNDDELSDILKITGKIDILLAQFSYAIGKTNKNETKKRKILASKILKNLSNTLDILKPNIFIPFASFCYFSRNDNFYLNDSINTINHTVDYLKTLHPNIKFYCFYPGDFWNLKNSWDNKESLKKYNSAYSNISPSNYKSDMFNFDYLNKSSKKFIYNTKSKNNLFFFYNFFKLKNHKIFFNVTDINKIFSFDFKKGLVEFNNISSNDPVCSLKSESLNQLFSSGYGYDALIIGGRFEANEHGLKNLNNIFKFQAKNYQNIYYNFNDVFLRLIKKIFNFRNKFFQR